MELIQQSLNFDVHKVENRLSSQLHLDEHRTHFSKQCSTLFNAFMSGDEITSLTSIQKYQIIDFRRRCCDLLESGVRLSERDELVNRCKVKYMTEQNKIDNKKFLRIGVSFP